MIKRLSKRGQVESSTMIYLIIAVVVLVVVVLGFVMGWDKILGWLKFAPDDLEKAAQGCGFAAEQNLKTTYCNEFKEVSVSGKKQFLNCDELEVYATFTNLEEGCDETQVNTLAKALCINEKLGDDELVNGVSCKVLRT
jgi:hypothetical protein